MTQADNMKNKKANIWLRAILVCASLALAFGAGIYVTSLLEPKADTIQNKTDNEKEVTEGENESVTSSEESGTDEDEFELPIVDADSNTDNPDDFTVSSEDVEIDISGYEPVETPEPVSSDTEEQPASSGSEEQPASSEAWDEDDELPEVPVYTAP